MNRNLTTSSHFRKFVLFLTFVLSLYSQHGISQNHALSFNGIDDYITFGNDSAFYLEEFTVECWFKRAGVGIATNTGNLGTRAYPLVTRGLAESDDNNRDLNYFMGIDSVTNFLVSDIEEGYFQYAPGLNHPIYGTTQILWNVWYHAAITFNQNQMSVYLNGQLEISKGWGVKTQSQSIQHAGVATGLTSYGLAKGFFHGEIDEVRIWNYARSIDDIQNNINLSISTPQTGLVGSWQFNEGSGAIANDSSGNNLTGAINGTWHNWVTGAPLNMSVNFIPDFPETLSPLNNDTCVAVNNTLLKIHSYDEGGDTIIIKYFGRPAHNSPPPFTIVPMPDTQHYVAEMIGGSTAGLKAQTNWIVANRVNKNIKFVSQLGDCVQNGNNGGNDIEWRRADTAFSILEDPITTGLVEGIPYSISVGNHDQSGMGNPNGSTLFYNQFFGTARFGGRSYYGGHYGINNDNHYSLFQASGMGFIEISMEYDTAANPLVVSWADSLLQVYSNRRAIVTSHYILDINGSFGSQGQALYDQLKDNPNLFLMLSGHRHDESRREDIFNGNTIYSILSDYQSRPGGGNGWIKLLDFRPEINKIFVKTYSPYIDMYETDWDSEYTLDYNMTPAFQFLGTDTVTSGSEGSFLWSGLQMDSTYEWYAEISDGKYELMTELNRFKTNNNEQVFVGNDITQCGGQVSFGTSDTNYTYLWSTGSTNSFITVNQTGNYTITATSNAGNCAVKDTILITINPIPDSYLGADSANCDQLILGATTGINFVYDWQNNSDDSVYTALNSGTFSLFIQDSITGCFSSDTIEVLIYPLPVINLGTDLTQCGGSVDIGVNASGNTYLWSTGNTNSVINTTLTGQYILTATSIVGGCLNADTISVTIHPIPLLNLGVDTALCAQIILNGTPGTNYIYTWNDGTSLPSLTANASGTYSLYMEDSLTGCGITDSINVIIYPNPVVNLGFDITQCGGDTVIGINDSLNTYLWSTGSTSSMITVNQTGNYVLAAMSNLGSCISKDSILVDINDIPQGNLASDTAGCHQIIINANIGNDYGYSWQNGINEPMLTIVENGQYIVSIENLITGCVNTDTIVVEIYPLPIIELGNDTSCIICDLNIYVIAGYQLYQWNTGATGNSIHVSTPGFYSVVVVDNNGCSARDSILISTSSIIYPNPFSDYFIVNLPDYQTIPTFKIFDELGRSVNFTFTRNGSSYLINTSAFAKGIYFLDILSGEEQKKFKVIKN